MRKASLFDLDSCLAAADEVEANAFFTIPMETAVFLKKDYTNPPGLVSMG